jgi:hypothetical protein
VQIQVGDHLGAGGETSFVFDRGEVFGWRMSIQGSRERLLDSVLPHEITHTVFASHFRQALPRWADEGACTTVEHPSEQRRHQQMLVQFLQTNRGLAFNRMFAMMAYPQDIMPLYAQGHSVSRYLIEQGGKRKYVDFVGEGLKTRDWPGAVRKHYGVRDLGVLQTTWLAWVKEGSPPLAQGPASDTQLASLSGQRRPRPAPQPIYRGQSADTPTPVSPAKSEVGGDDRVAWPPAGTAPLRRAASPTKGSQETPAPPAAPQPPAGELAIPINAPRSVLLEWGSAPAGDSPSLPAVDAVAQNRSALRRAPLLEAGSARQGWR